MIDEANEGKKTEVLARIERLRELVEEDAPGLVTERAHEEIRRSMDGLYREGRAEGDAPAMAEPGESPPSL